MAEGAAAGTYSFLLHAALFIHRPHRAIPAMVNGSARASAILYTELESYAYGYYPMVYDNHGQLAQWFADGQGIVRLPIVNAAQPLSALSAFHEVIVVDIRLRHYGDLRACLEGTCPKLPTAPVVAEMVGSGRWSLVSQRRVFGLYDALLTRMRERAPPC